MSLEFPEGQPGFCNTSILKVDPFEMRRIDGEGGFFFFGPLFSSGSRVSEATFFCGCFEPRDCVIIFKNQPRKNSSERQIETGKKRRETALARARSSAARPKVVGVTPHGRLEQEMVGISREGGGIRGLPGAQGTGVSRTFLVVIVRNVNDGVFNHMQNKCDKNFKEKICAAKPTPPLDIRLDNWGCGNLMGSTRGEGGSKGNDNIHMSLYHGKCVLKLMSQMVLFLHIFQNINIPFDKSIPKKAPWFGLRCCSNV